MTTATDLSATARLLEQSTESGMFCRGAQLYVSVGGVPALSMAVGLARPGRRATTDHIFPVYCATKPLVALATLIMSERGVLDLDRPLSAYLPAWCGAPIGSVTTREILAHRSGLPASIAVLGAFPDHRKAVETLSRVPVKRPREGMRYAPSWGFLALGVVFHQLGVDVGRLVEDEVLKPLRIPECWVPIKQEDLDVSGHVLGTTWTHVNDVLLPRASEGLEVDSFPDLSTGGYASARALGRFFEALLEGEVVERGMISEASYETMITAAGPDAYDPTLRRACTFGLGVMVDLAKHCFSDTCSPRSFGHNGGSGLIFAIADPADGLVVACIFPTVEVGDPGPLTVGRRTHLIETIRRELALAG